jgi:hypothetical protein
MPKRINGGLAVAAVGALLLIVSLFLDWFSPGRSGWTSFELNDLLLAALALLVLAIAVGDALEGPEARRFVPEGSVVYAAIGALIIVAASLIQPPPGALHSSREIGAWLGLVATLVMLAGGLAMRARVSLVISLRGGDQSRRAAPTQGVAAYEPGEPADGSQGFEEEVVATGEPGEVPLEEYPPGHTAPEPAPPESIPPEEPPPSDPYVDPDTETRQYSEPTG